jgi:tRNA threonylcarbamoyladenosine biosynthesis protein TsaE
MKTVTHSPKETDAFAKKWLEDLIIKRKDDEKGKAIIVGLYGDLGSGKTTFTQAVARALGIEEIVTSPTFVIEKIYALNEEKKEKIDKQSTCFTHLIHIDAYRLEKSDELARLGWNEIIGNPANLILIEWPEKVADIMPADHIKLKFVFLDETTREIEE